MTFLTQSLLPPSRTTQPPPSPSGQARGHLLKLPRCLTPIFARALPPRCPRTCALQIITQNFTQLSTPSAQHSLNAVEPACIEHEKRKLQLKNKMPFGKIEIEIENPTNFAGGQFRGLGPVEPENWPLGKTQPIRETSHSEMFKTLGGCWKSLIFCLKGCSPQNLVYNHFIE